MRIQVGFLCLGLALLQGPVLSGTSQRELEDGSRILAAGARTALEKGIAFFHSISIEGGYVYHYTLDLTERWGEGRTDHRTIEVQPPGTPAVGQSFFRAYRIVGDEAFLRAAEEAADALIRGQNDLGGWGHKIYFDGPKSKIVSFDDDQTQSAIRFLMELDQELDNPSLSSAIEKALKMMMSSQMDHGGWPHRYPREWSYHDFATFNDGGINDCISVMQAAHRHYGRVEYMESLQKAGWFLILSQLPPPQPGWAQQYNQYLQPAWARAFEPPAVCSLVTIRNIHTLIDLYSYTGSGRYLEPIPDALRWLESTRLQNGKWARFVEIGTGKPLYYDRGRIRVESVDELSIERRTGYGYEQDLSAPLQEAKKRFEEITKKGRDAPSPGENLPRERAEVIKRLSELKSEVAGIIESQDEKGRWIVKNDRYRKVTPGKPWTGEYETKDRISSALFNRNVGILCEFLELVESLQ
jgi:rhamnogalacturonyl hydrolase YesR